jgi:hypothetical protein
MLRKSLMAISVAALFSPGAWAAASADEAKQLGTTLTAVGAEKAGNKDGTIPEWTGTPMAVPAGYKKGDGIRPDPYASEKPRLTITGKDMAAHADKLTEGTKELLKRYPTMRVDVYPTHRNVVFPKKIQDNTLKNAVSAKSVEGGLGIEGMLPGYPFPIPKNGNEVIWNYYLRYGAVGYTAKYENWNVDGAGVPTLALVADGFYEYPPYAPSRLDTVMKETDGITLVKLYYVGPARRAGEALLVKDYVNPLKQGRKAWQYLPGQRRVKLAPDIAYDTPNPGTNGTSTYDDAFVYNGAMDRYDYKLIGKKEMYVPYNGYRLQYVKTPADAAKPYFVNPDLMRWELHRVWVVEATLKPDKRHIYQKRTFYVDEDSWVIEATDQYDARGQLYRSSYNNWTYDYDQQAINANNYMIYDFIAGSYAISGLSGGYFGVKPMDKPMPEAQWAAETLAGAGIR